MGGCPLPPAPRRRRMSDAGRTRSGPDAPVRHRGVNPHNHIRQSTRARRERSGGRTERARRALDRSDRAPVPFVGNFVGSFVGRGHFQDLDVNELGCLLSPSLSSAPSEREGVRRTGEEARFMGRLPRKLCVVGEPVLLDWSASTKFPTKEGQGVRPFPYYANLCCMA